MGKPPSTYARFQESQLILRDELALERTILANERTLLAYLRTGMALLIAGATIIHFAQGGWFLLAGVACIPAGILCAIAGTFRFSRVNRSIRVIRSQLPPSPVSQPTNESDAP